MAADYDFSIDPWAVLTVAAGAAKTVLLPLGETTIQHLGYQNDALDASVDGDQLIVMRGKTAAGVVVTMDPTLADGIKLPLAAGAAAVFKGADVPAGADGPREIQIQAVGHAAKVLLVRGNLFIRG